jgi:RHS repeat-associated protein
LGGLAALVAAGLQAVPAPASPLSAAALAAVTVPSTGQVGSVSGPLPAAKAASAPALWTANSRTTLEADGKYQTKVWPAAVNYRDTNGSWQPIDDALTVASDGTAVNGANSWQVSLPKTLSDPVKVSDGAAWVSFGLVGASPAATSTVAGSTATYAAVVPGVTAAYTVENDRLAETLTLADAQAQSSFRFDVAASSGVSVAQAADGGLTVKADGVKVFELAAPTLADSSHTAAGDSPNATLRAVPAGAGWTVTLAADPAWLEAPGRVWPVVIDPTVTLGAYDTQGCNFTSDNPTTNYCNQSTYYVGHGTGGGAGRGTFQFDDITAAIPRDAVVDDSVLSLYENGPSSTTNATSLEVHGLTQGWTTGATWNTSDGTTAWPTSGGAGTTNGPGGDYTTASAWTLDGAQNTAAQWIYFHPTALVQGWVHGTAANDGFLLKAADEGVNNVLTVSSFNDTPSLWPSLTIDYTTNLNTSAAYSAQLDDRLGLSVDAASGNLSLAAEDFHLAGTGLALNAAHYYNSADSAGASDLGYGWSTSLRDTAIYVTPSGVQLGMANGQAYAFYGSGTCGTATFTSPPGINASLCEESDGVTYDLTFNTSQEVWKFKTISTGPNSAIGYRTSDTDRNGNTLTYNWDLTHTLSDGLPALDSVTDTRSHTLTVSNPNGPITGYTDPTSRTVGFTTTSGNTTSITDPTGQAATYGYTGSLLTEITTPAGRITTIGYNTNNQVASITRVTNNATLTGLTTTFTYTAFASGGAGITATTTVTDPRSNNTVYTYDTFDNVDNVADANGHNQAASYTANNDPATLTNGLTQATTLSYNVNNNLTQATEPASASGQTPVSNYLSYATPTGDKGAAWLTSSNLDGEGSCTAYNYDSAGNPTTTYSGLTPTVMTTNCDGGTTGTGVTSTTNAYQGDGTTTCGAKPGELCTTTSGKGGVTAYAYNTTGQVTTVTAPGGACTGTRKLCTTYTYDTAGRVATVTDGKNQTTTYSYDNDDRPTQALYNGATTCTYSAGTCLGFGYDTDGNVTGRHDSTGLTTYVYDPLNRLTGQQLPAGANACTGSSPAAITYTYDAASNLAAYCDAGGTIKYAYDPANRMVGVATGTGSCTPGSVVQPCSVYTYDNANELTKITYPNTTGVTETFGHNNAGNTTTAAIAGGTATAGTYTYSYKQSTTDKPLIQSMVRSATAVTTTYTYNGHDQLTGAATGTTSTSQTYGYDADGNLTTQNLGGTNHTMAYTTADQLCWAYTGTSANPCGTTPTGAVTYAYDADGNQTTSSAGETNTYNTVNQTASMTAPTGGTAVSMAYTGTDNTQRTTAGSTTFTTSTLGVATSTTSGTTTYFTRDPAGRLNSIVVAGTRYYYLYDGTGSIVGLITTAGAQVATYTYTPYGTTTTSGTQAANNPFRYEAGYQDTTSYYKFGARYYNPTLTTWTQTDPSGQDAGYIYVGDNPINLSDPTGDIGGTTGPTCSPQRQSLCGHGGGFGALLSENNFFNALEVAYVGISCVAGGTAGFAAAGPAGAVYSCAVAGGYAYGTSFAHDG